MRKDGLLFELGVLERDLKSISPKTTTHAKLSARKAEIEQLLSVGMRPVVRPTVINDPRLGTLVSQRILP